MDEDLRQGTLTSFLEIAVGQSSEAATQFLEATGWNLEEALQLFFVSNETRTERNTTAYSGHREIRDYDGDYVRPPLSVRREALYDHEEVWEANNGSSDSLTSMYTRPSHLIYQGSFEEAKQVGSIENKWLLVNLQSDKEFGSHTLNRDTWSNEALAQIIKSNFIFWQENNDTVEGKKVQTFYKLVDVPVILVIDPITGQKMQSLTGMIEPDFLMNELVQFINRSPKEHLVAIRPKHLGQETVDNVEVAQDDEEDENVLVPSADSTKNSFVSSSRCEVQEDDKVLTALADSTESMSTSSCEVEDVKVVDEEPESTSSSSIKPTYPPLPEEPKGLDRKLVCRVGVRLPDSRRVQRCFLLTEPIQLLWSFCASQLDEGEGRCFRLAYAIPGASVTLDYASKVTFEESGLANSMVSVIMVD